MTEKHTAKPRGTGRVAFIGRLDTIRADIAKGEFLVTIYAKHQASLGITYSAFRKLVQRYAEDAKPRKRAPYGADRSPAVAAAVAPCPAPVSANRSAPPVESLPTQTESPARARHEPAGRPTFHHHGIVQEGEPERLFGPGFLPRRGG